MPRRDTPLLSAHQRAGAKIIEFANWRLPVQFASVASEVTACRERAAVFDISHMGLIWVRGPAARQAVASLLTRDVRAMPPGRAAYALMLNEHGGILDDLFVLVEPEDQVLLIVNAVNHDRDVAWVLRHLAGYRELTLHDGCGQTFGIALQGPQAEAILCAVAPGQEPPPRFATCRAMTIRDARVLVSRTGYTGEDGFEIFGDAARAETVWEALLAAPTPPGPPAPAGLAARDVLRQEMGYPLYGNDLDVWVIPAEAALSWAVDWSHHFVGADALAARRPRKRRVGFVVHDEGVARHGDIVMAGGEPVGQVSSGTYSHGLRAAIGQAYVATVPRLRAGDPIQIVGRGRALSARVADFPLVPARTRRGRVQEELA